VLETFPQSFRVIRQRDSTNYNHSGETFVTSTFVGSFNNSRSGGTLPSWKSLIKAGLNATTTFNGIDCQLEYAPGYAMTKGWTTGGPQNWRQIEVHGALTTPASCKPGDPSLYDSSAPDSEALGQFYSSIRSRQRSFQGGVFLGELAETLRMIRSPVKALRQGIDHYVSSARRRARRERSDRRKNAAIAETWLEYQYGWRPLYSDAIDAYKTLTKKSRAFAHGENLPVRGHGSSDADFGGVTTIDGSVLSYSAKIQLTGSVEVRYIGAVKGKPSSPSLGNAAIWGLSPSDFVPTIWNLIPYTFLVDYFTNAGTVIESWSTCTSGLSWKCRTTRKLAFGTYIGWQITGGYSNTLSSSLSPPTIKWTRKTISRSVPVLGTPDLIFRLPGSSTKFLNIAALFRARRV